MAPAIERTRTLTFAQMGQPNGVRLSGVNRFVDLNSGIRLDELVTRANLSLKVLYPQGMRHDQSFVRVYVNNQLSGLSQLSVARAGVPHTVDIELDPLLFPISRPFELNTTAPTTVNAWTQATQPCVLTFAQRAR